MEQLGGVVQGAQRKMILKSLTYRLDILIRVYFRIFAPGGANASGPNIRGGGKYYYATVYKKM